MAAKTMPVKLLVVVIFMAIGIVINLFTGAYVSAIISTALVLGILAGNDGVRTFLRALAVIQILWAAIVLGSVSGRADVQVVAIAAVFAFGIPIVMIVFLGQDDVREWMFRKNFHLDEGSDPPPPSV